MHERGGTIVCRAKWMVATSIYSRFWSLLRYCTDAELLRDSMGTFEECHVATFLSLRELSWKYLSMNDTPTNISSTIFQTISNHTRTVNSPMPKNNMMVPPSEICCFSSWQCAGVVTAPSYILKLILLLERLRWVCWVLHPCREDSCAVQVVERCL